MKIAIVTAMAEETRAALKAAQLLEKPLLKKMKIYRARIAGHDIDLIESGMGMFNAGRAAAELAVQKPELLISVGFGGAVRPGLAVGDAVMAERVLHWGGKGFEEVAVGFFDCNNSIGNLSLTCGTFISCDVILDKRELRSRLAECVPNPVVEMESAAVARVAATESIPFLGIRVVSDPWNEELGFAIHEFCDESMRIRPARVLATILRRPRIIPQLVRLARNSRIAAASLAGVMERLLQQI